MDKLTALQTAIDEIIDDDHVSARGDGSYEVRQPDGTETLRVQQIGNGEWTAAFESGRAIPNAPRQPRPHEVIAWALLG